MTNQACYFSAPLSASPYYRRPDPRTGATYRSGEGVGLAYDHRAFPKILTVHTLANSCRVSQDSRVDESSQARPRPVHPCPRSFHFSRSKPAVADSTDVDNVPTPAVVKTDINPAVSHQTSDSHLLSVVLASTRCSENKALLKQAKLSLKEIDSSFPLINASNPETMTTTKEGACALAEKDETPAKDNDKEVSAVA